MTLPLFDPIDLPPDTVLVDVHSVADEALRESYQAQALAAWVEDTGGSWDVGVREWSDGEGIFVVHENGIAIGVAVVLDVEGL